MQPFFRSFALALWSFILVTPGLAEIYQWTDEHGKRHFTDQKPAGRRVESFKGGATVSILGGGARIQANKVRLFVTRQCPYCRKAKAFLNQRGAPFEELDVEASRSADAEFKRLGGKGVPVILVGQQRMDGYDQARLEEMLQQAGL